MAASKLSLLIAALVILQSCGLNSRRMPEYADVPAGDRATVTLDEIKLSPQVHQVEGRGIGARDSFGSLSAEVYLYKNHHNCTDISRINDANLRIGNVVIAADEWQTVDVKAKVVRNRHVLWCSNIFSFKPKGGHVYAVNLKVLRTESRLAECEVLVADRQDSRPIPLVSRSERLGLWDDQGPRCAPDELNEPVFRATSVAPVRCVTRIGRHACSRDYRYEVYRSVFE